MRKPDLKALCRVAADASQSVQRRVKAVEALRHVPFDSTHREEILPAFIGIIDGASPVPLVAAALKAGFNYWWQGDRVQLRRLVKPHFRSPSADVAHAARQVFIHLMEPQPHDLPSWNRRGRPQARRGTDAEFLQRAIDLAVENVETGRGGPFGAVITHKGRVIAEGTNLVTLSNDPSNHAEVLAIREAAFRLQRVHLEDCVIYSSCEPCPMCLGAIHWARIGKLYFAATREDAAAAGFDDSFIYDQVPLAPAARSIPATRKLTRAGASPLQSWTSTPERIEYYP